MPEIDRARLSAKLDTIPEADREPYVQALKAQGYTWNVSGALPAQMTTAGAAKQAISETMTQDVPYLGKIAKAVRTDIPGYIAEGAGRAGAAIERAGGAIGLPGAGKAVGNAVGVAGATAGTALGTAGELIPQKGWELAAMGAAKPLGAAVKTVGATVAPPLISFLTRIEPPIVARAISRAGQLGNKELLAPEAIENAIQGLGEGIKAGRRALGEKLGAIEDKIAATFTGNVPAADIGQKLSQNLAKAGFGVEGQPVGKVVRELNKEVSAVLGDFQTLNFKDAINLRRKIDDMVTYDGAKLLGLNDTQQAMLKGARSELNDRIRAVSPRYTQATAAFSKAAQVYDQLSKDVLSGKPETIQRRITGMFNKGSADRKIVERVDKISETAGASLDTILDSITAQKFDPILNPGMTRAAGSTGGGILGATGIAAGKVLAGGPGAGIAAGAITATSPRLHALGIRAFNSPIGAGAIPPGVLPVGSAAAAIAALRARREGR